MHVAINANHSSARAIEEKTNSQNITMRINQFHFGRKQYLQTKTNIMFSDSIVRRKYDEKREQTLIEKIYYI